MSNEENSEDKLARRLKRIEVDTLNHKLHENKLGPDYAIASKLKWLKELQRVCDESYWTLEELQAEFNKRYGR